MRKFKSTRAVIINAEEQISGTILAEVNSPIHDIKSGKIRCNITYFHKEESRHLSSKTWVLSNENASVLLQSCINSPENIDELLSGFLLENLKNNSAYGILPEEWAIDDQVIIEASEE